MKKTLPILLVLVLLLSFTGIAVSGAADVRLSFSADGKPGAYEDLTCTAGEGIALPWPDDLVPPEGQAFGGWTVAGKTYQPGEVVYPTADTVYAAVWTTPVTIYISPKKGSSGNSGTSEATPVPDISSAQSKLKGINSGTGSPYSNTFVILDPLTTSKNGTTVTVPVSIVEVSDSGAENDGENGALLNIGGTVLCKHAVWIRNLSMADTGSHNLCACGNPLRLSDISVPAGSFAVGTVAGAGSSTNYPQTTTGITTAVATSLRIDGGTFNIVYGGGLTVAASDTFVEINGGSVTTLYGGGNTADISGNAKITVNDGTVSTLYAGGNAANVKGKAEIYINGGSVSSLHTGCQNTAKTVAGGATVGCSGEFVPVSYNAGTGVGVLKAEAEYRFGDTLRLAYPSGLSRENQEFYGWSADGKVYQAGEAFPTGNTYLSFTAEWRAPADVWVDAQNGNDANVGTKTAPKKTLAGANAYLKDVKNGGSVYVNRLHIVGEYKVSGTESLGTNPCALTEGTLTIPAGTTLVCEADVRFACTVQENGTVSAPISSAAVCVDSNDAAIAALEAAGGVTVLRGKVGTLTAEDVCVRGGVVNTLSAGDVRLSQGEIQTVAKAKTLTVCGGALCNVTADKTELFIRTDHHLTLNGAFKAETFLGGGSLSFGSEGALQVTGRVSGKTEVRSVAPASQKKVITGPAGVQETAFSGENLRFDGTSWNTPVLVTRHIGDETVYTYADGAGNFDLPTDLRIEGYEFFGYYLDAAFTLPYTYASADRALELYTKATPNAKAVFRLNTTGGKVECNGTLCGAVDTYSQFSAWELYDGAQVHLVAKPTSSRIFLFWLEEKTGKILSTEPDYTFRVTGDTEITAMFANSSSGQYTVTFVGAGGRLIDCYTVARGSVPEAEKIPASPDLIPGKKFVGWDKDVTEKVMSNTLYRAVYEDAATQVTQTETGADVAAAKVAVTRILSAEASVTFVAEWKLPAGTTLLRAGIVLTGADGKTYTGIFLSQAAEGSYYLTKGTAGGNTWTARAFVSYATAEGKVVSVEGEPVTGSCGAAGTASVNAEALGYYLTLDGGLTVQTSMTEFYESVIDTSKESYSYDEMMEDLILLAGKHSDKITVISIGQSVLCRNLPVVVMGNTKAEYRMFVKATDHAREWINTVIVMKQIEFYLENWNNEFNGQKVSDIFQSVCICFEPMANPDGVMLSQQGLASIADESLREQYARLLTPIMQKEQAAMVRGVDYDDDLDISELCDENGIWWGRWAANINGVDLHRDYYEESLAMYNKNFRNYVAKHQTPDTKDAFGSCGLSQPETRAVADYIARTGFNLSFTYHSYSPCLQLPMALCEEGQLAKNQKLITELGKVTSYNLNSNTGSLDKNAVNAGYNNWFICKYPHTACFTIETGYRQIDGHADNTPLKMAQITRLFSQNKYGPLYIATYARDNHSVDALSAN